MRLEDFSYELPAECIAQRPAERRDEARLLVHDLPRGSTEHARVHQLKRFLAPGDLLVWNDTRVLSAKLFARRASGGRVELLFLEPVDDPAGAWRVFANPARKLRSGERLLLPQVPLEVRMHERPLAADGRPGKEWIASIAPAGAAADTLWLLERHGSVPLPPYIERPNEPSAESSRGGGPEAFLDRERYQTIYARPDALGAVAAPTAGLHFTPELLAALEEHGVRHAALTLHVGAGTFEPVEAVRLEDHHMHSERYELPAATVAAIDQTRRRGGRVVCVGTTSVRVLESVAQEYGSLRAARGRTELFLRPGSRFLVTDSLLTNFHLPRSTLFVLVCAFAGRERMLDLYARAIERGYRFYSYGDAMLLHGSRRGGERD